MKKIFGTLVLAAILVQPAKAMIEAPSDSLKITKITIDKEKLISTFLKHNIQDLRPGSLIDNLSKEDNHPAMIVMSVYSAVWVCTDQFNYTPAEQQALENKICDVLGEVLADQPETIRALVNARKKLSAGKNI